MLGGIILSSGLTLSQALLIWLVAVCAVLLNVMAVQNSRSKSTVFD
jgi:hypothetical protein